VPHDADVMPPLVKATYQALVEGGKIPKSVWLGAAE